MTTTRLSQTCFRMGRSALSKSQWFRALSTQPHTVAEHGKHHNVYDLTSGFRSYPATTNNNSPPHQLKFPHHHRHQDNNAFSLESFIEKIPSTLQQRQEMLARDPSSLDGGNEDPVLSLFRNLNLTCKDWAPYAHFADPSRAYTRNLIYTDHETFTLLLLCWNTQVESKVHDHPCDGCWMQVLEGEIQECRYEYPSTTTSSSKPSSCNEGEDQEQLQCIADQRFRQGQVAFINDYIGLHKVGNPHPSVPAVTLHLYAPPFQDCQVWMDETNAGSSIKVSCDRASHFSEYGFVDGGYLP